VAKKLKVTPYLDREAAEPILTRGDCPQILLIATHGYFSEAKQPYVKLIQTLAQCPEGQQREILASYGELMNDEFLHLLKVNAKWFAESGKEDLANWYQDLVTAVFKLINHRQHIYVEAIRESPLQDGVDRSRLNNPNLNNPMMRSGLALAGANRWIKNEQLPDEIGKGFIWAQDIAGLDLWGNELTVLSACNTAMGDVKIGEGVLGMRRAFAIAGCKTLVMSLWPVPDKATALLMERLFDNLHQGLGRGDALQEAQNYLRNITIQDLQQFELGCQVLEELNDKIAGKSDNYQPLADPVYWGGLGLPRKYPTIRSILVQASRKPEAGSRKPS
jgi:hypothetical protein